MRLRADRLLELAVGLAVAACGDDCEITAPVLKGEACTPEAERRFVWQVTRSHHLFADRLADVDPNDFETPRQVLDALVAPIPEDRFSFIASASGEVRFFVEGQTLGYGLSVGVRGDEVRVLDVLGQAQGDAPSSAARAGIERGDRIEAVDGEPVQILLAEDRFSEALGPYEPGTRHRVSIRDRSGDTRTVDLEIDFFAIVPVPVVQVLDRSEGPVGYLVLRNFTEPADVQLEAAAARFEEAGVERLVLDLRYNGGGLISTANLLGDLLLGPRGPRRVWTRSVFNARNAGCNRPELLQERPASLRRLRELVVLTLPGTASASELVVNSLKSWVQTHTVGRTTFGKPVGQLGFGFCEAVLRPITFRIVNADGEGDYFEGIAPDCRVDDDPTRPFADVQEGMLQAALSVLEEGECPGQQPKGRARERADVQWRALERPDAPERIRRMW